MTRLATEAEVTLSSFFEEMRSRGATRLREEAWARFSHPGLPNRRVESWHYTDLKNALRKPAPLAVPGESKALARMPDALRLVILDGAFRADLSDVLELPDGVAAQSLREALAQGDAEILSALAGAGVDDAAVALNAALMQDGVVLRIAEGAKIARGVEIAHVSSSATPQSIFTRSLALIGAGAQVKLLESHHGSGAPAQENTALVLGLADGASVELVSHVCGLGEDGVRVASLLARLAERATLASYALVEGEGLLRRQIFASVDGEHARVAFDGATLARGRAHLDTTLVVDHKRPYGESRERFRSILDENGVGVFQGKIIVRPGAQKTDGAMQSKALLLSDNATMNNKPELEIFADDVQCGHGATCGRLDKDQLFYLTARGLPRAEAEALLIEGFANEAFEGLEETSLRDFVESRISAWLAGRVTP